MATSERKVKSKSDEEELKHLGFVMIAAIKLFVCISNLYAYAKKNSGPLRSAVGTVEDTVTTVLGPLYHKFNFLPLHLLLFLDNKVDEGSHKLEELAPPLVKQVTRQAKGLIMEMRDKAEKVVSEAECGGAGAAAQYVATESKQFVVIGSVKLWSGLNHYPPFHAVAEMTIPTAAHWSEKYNQMVKNMSGKGYGLFGYLPLIPIDDIAKAFRHGEANNVNGDDQAASVGQCS
ncbi:hypothetical protein VNO77_01338 [Canavalia gladiata]|uniref:REF/SRPP-like protein n=1 Tax=Canavalia gladiata TaxID=3824 RepID=A0AAN9MQZ2_CANGL